MGTAIKVRMVILDCLPAAHHHGHQKSYLNRFAVSCSIWFAALKAWAFTW